VLDDGQQPVGPGVVGALHVSSRSVAPGWINLPEESAASFSPDPFEPGRTLFRTGDYCVRREDGNLEYRGRRDDQLKVRGSRVEPQEVEAALGEHPAVACSAVVAGRINGRREIVAYYVCGPGCSLAAPDARRWVAARVPEHMIPGRFCQLDALPLTVTGKVDRGVLAARDTVLATGTIEPPRNDLEARILRAWKRALRENAVGVTSDFFEHGGNSLAAIEVLSELSRIVGLRLPLATIFEHPTVAQLALHVERMAARQPDCDRERGIL
jgi:hypothetical protein